jgi:hypothetical protein
VNGTDPREINLRQLSKQPWLGVCPCCQRMVAGRMVDSDEGQVLLPAPHFVMPIGSAVFDVNHSCWRKNCWGVPQETRHGTALREALAADPVETAKRAERAAEDKAYLEDELGATVSVMNYTPPPPRPPPPPPPPPRPGRAERAARRTPAFEDPLS